MAAASSLAYEYDCIEMYGADICLYMRKLLLVIEKFSRVDNSRFIADTENWDLNQFRLSR